MAAHYANSMQEILYLPTVHANQAASSEEELYPAIFINLSQENLFATEFARYLIYILCAPFVN